MKALKLVLIATVVCFATMNFAAEVPHGIKAEKVRIIKITLEEAQTSSGLVNAMYQQLTPAFLQVEQPGLYVARVNYKYKIVEISGTRTAWVEFFRGEPGWAPITKSD